MVFFEACRAENGDAGPHKVQFAEALDELPGNSQREVKFLPSAARPFQKGEQVAEPVFGIFFHVLLLMVH